MDGAGKPLTITAAIFGGTILIFCCLIAYLISLPLSWFADHEDLLTLRQEYQGTVSGGGAELAAIAESEYAQYGNTSCGSRYWTAPHDWCSDFVYWCADQLGLVGSDQLFGSWTSYVPTAIDQLIKNGAAYFGPADGVTPQPGDIVTWWGGGRAGRASDYSPGAHGRHIAIAVEGTEGTVSWPWQRALQVHEGPDKALPLLPENPAPGIGATRTAPLPETPPSVPLVTAAETAYLQGKPLLSSCRSVAGVYVDAPQHPSHRRHSHTVFRLPAPHGPSGSEQPQLSISPADFCNLVDCEIYRLSGSRCAGTRAVYRQESLSQPEGLLFVQLLLPHSDPGGRATLGITEYSIPCFAEIDKSWGWSDF